MANRFWVGATATWDATAGTKWATTSGGAGGAAVPTAADDVFFDSSSSGTVTMSASSTGRSLDCNGFTGTLQHPAATTISFGDATAGSGNRAFRLGSGMTYVIGNATTSILSFISTSATVQTVTCAGKTVPSMTFNGVGGSWQLSDTLTAGATSTITLTNGTLDTNGQTVNVGLLASSNSNVRTLTLGASTINISGTSATAWNFTTTTNLTFNANTSTINFVTGSATLVGGSQTFNNIAWVSGTGGLTITGANTFNNVTFNTGSGIRTFQFGGNQTINGVLTCTGLNVNLNRLRFGTTVRGTTRTITMGASSSYSFTNVDFEDIAFAGTGLPITGTSLGDQLGNSNITFTPAVNRFWVGNAGSASDSAHWSATSGGAGGASVPLEQDNWFVDANSFTTTGQTLTMDRARFGKNADFTGLAFPITLLNGNQSSAGLSFFGNVTFTSNVTTSVTGTSPSWGFFGRGPQTITSAGANFNSNVTSAVVNFNGVGGTYTLQDNFSTNATVVLNNGTLDANGKNVTCSVFSSSVTNTRALTMGSGTWTLTGTGTILQLSTMTNLTFSGASSTILITDTSASSKTLAHGSTIALGTITITPGGAGAVIFGNNLMTLGTLNCTGGSALINFPTGSGSTTTITAFNVSGTSGNLVTMASVTPGTQFIISVASGLVQSSFVSLQDSAATGGAYFLAYRSTNAGNNTGWNFTQQRVAVSGRVPASGRVPVSGRVAVSNRYKLL